MADYRSWCASCNKEVNFGSHDPGCDYLHAQRIAHKEQREWEQEFWKSHGTKGEDEVYEELAEEIRYNQALRDGLYASGKKIDALRDIAMNNSTWSKIYDRLRDNGLRFPR